MGASATELSSPQKELAPGVRKQDLADHWARVAERALPHLADRALTLVRCPDGLASCFFQKHAREGVAPELGRVLVEERDGPAEYWYVDDAAGLAALAQLAAVELHVGWARRDRPDRPDRMVFDLDPGRGVELGAVVAAARDVRDRLARRHPPEEVRGFAEALARQMSKDAPDRYVATMDRDARVGRVFVDWMRNGPGATAIAPYSPRARSGFPVAVPVRWRELGGIDASDAYPLHALPRRLGALGSDPWEGWQSLEQRLPS